MHIYDEIFFYLYWTISKKIQVHVFPKKVSLWVGCVKFLSPHEKMTCKIIPWQQQKRKHLKTKTKNI